MKILASIIGITGKMGKEVVKCANDSFEIVGGVSSKDIDKLDIFFKKSQVAIDFSNSTSLEKVLYYAEKNSTPLVIGTTGYSDEDFRSMKKASKNIPILYSSNFSLGIALLRFFALKTTDVFSDSHIDIIEKHHIFKKDKPSGTALSVANDLQDKLKNKINIHSIRAADIVGEHSIFFTNSEEVLEIKHSVSSRTVFAKGAIKAAKFIYDKKPGFYSIQNLFEGVYAKN